MKDFQLTGEQILELRQAHRLERKRNASAAYKINAILLLGTGWSTVEVSEALLLNEDTLRSYISKYLSGHIKGLTDTHYFGRTCHLSEAQQRALCQELESSIYLTVVAVADYVSREFSINYSVSGMRDLLHRLGYEYKKPKLVPGYADLEAQEEFISYYEDYMESKSCNTEVLFIDAVHPEHNTMAAYGWIKRGQTRKLPTNSGRQRLNLHGAINVETLDMTVIESSTVNADSTIELLETLNQKYADSDSIHIILDNARYHYSSVVKSYLAKTPRINLVFLPTYSPELNLIERVWRYFKKSVLYNKYYSNLSDFREATKDFFNKIGEHKKALASLLSGGFQTV